MLGAGSFKPAIALWPDQIIIKPSRNGEIVAPPKNRVIRVFFGYTHTV
jgi:hypothetical protein